MDGEIQKSSPGSLIGSIIVVVIIIIGGIYLFSSRLNQTPSPTAPTDNLPANDAGLSELENQSQADDLVSIENDLNQSNLDLLDEAVNDLNRSTDTP